jgi:hypothetical protein
VYFSVKLYPWAALVAVVALGCAETTSPKGAATADGIEETDSDESVAEDAADDSDSKPRGDPSRRAKEKRKRQYARARAQAMEDDRAAEAERARAAEEKEQNLARIAAEKARIAAEAAVAADQANPAPDGPNGDLGAQYRGQVQGAVQSRGQTPSTVAPASSTTTSASGPDETQRLESACAAERKARRPTRRNAKPLKGSACAELARIKGG